MLNIARDRSAVVGQAAAPVAEITVLVFGFIFFVCVSWCELSAVSRSLGKGAKYVPLDKQISASY